MTHMRQQYGCHSRVTHPANEMYLVRLHNWTRISRSRKERKDVFRSWMGSAHFIFRFHIPNRSLYNQVPCSRLFGFQRYFVFNFRYNEKVKEIYRGNEECLKIAKYLLDWFHKFVLCLDASPNWFSFSPSGSLHYKQCDGDQLLHWKEKGYKTILDILTVSQRTYH